jgi:hypothetical protein
MGAPPLSGKPATASSLSSSSLSSTGAAAQALVFIVVFLNVIAPVWAITLPSITAPPAVKSILVPAKKVPGRLLAPSIVMPEAAVQ